MIKKLFFSLALSLSFTDGSWAASSRCFADLRPGQGAQGGHDYCQLRVDGKDYKKVSASNCVCPPDSELPPVNIVIPVVEYEEDMAPAKKPAKKEKAPVKIQAFIDGNKKRKIIFNCKSKLVTNVDVEGKPTGLVSCQLMDGEEIVSEVRIEDESKDQIYAKKSCQCQKKMEIPQAELTPYGMSLIDAVENPNECKLISSALSSDRLFQFCLIEIGGKQQVSYGKALNDCKYACQNNKVSCSLNIEEERSLAPKINNKTPVSSPAGEAK